MSLRHPVCHTHVDVQGKSSQGPYDTRVVHETCKWSQELCHTHVHMQGPYHTHVDMQIKWSQGPYQTHVDMQGKSYVGPLHPISHTCRHARQVK